ncbi:hypothetical Protein YC6258_05861 [Gynuella sunshinyii YC6258]|uniref:Uncharacterized protein n=1 Tax=Gynuella sunshinyii YC6258 TaxID=1445510 RepID=A0A0C5W5K7_9GAMM|nr:hypothetical Protein YC6258_05861 [Gynuella sunshinyii YC6258]
MSHATTVHARFNASIMFCFVRDLSLDSTTTWQPPTSKSPWNTD